MGSTEADDPDQEQVIFAMFLGAVAGAIVGEAVFQDTWQGIVVGIGLGTFLVMTVPSKFDYVYEKLEAAVAE